MAKPNADIILRGQKRGGLLIVAGAAEGRAPDPVLTLFPVVGVRTALVIWCAGELAPPIAFEGGPRVSSIPIAPLGASHALSTDQVAMLNGAAIDAADVLKEGGHVVIASGDGRDRAPIVAALTIHSLEGCGGRPAMTRVRALRLHAPGPVLEHPASVQLLGTLPARIAERNQKIDLRTLVLK